jgi:hypothetical protein
MNREEHPVHTPTKKRAPIIHAGSIRPPKMQQSVFASIVDNTPDGRSIPEEEIRLRAYHKWEDAGKPIGDGVKFWLEAERELVRGL